MFCDELKEEFLSNLPKEMRESLEEIEPEYFEIVYMFLNNYSRREIISRITELYPDRDPVEMYMDCRFRNNKAEEGVEEIYNEIGEDRRNRFRVVE